MVLSEQDLDYITANDKPSDLQLSEQVPLLNLSFIKLISNGSNQGLTGYQYKPYCCNDQYQPDTVAGNIGAFNFDPVSAFTSIMTKAKKANWSIMIHANGDQAIDLTIEAFKMAYNDLELESTMQHMRRY